MQGPTDNQSPLAPPLAPATLEACTEALTRLLRHTPEAKNWLVPVSLPGTSLGAPSGEGSARVVVPFLSIRAFKHLDLRAVPSQDILRTFCSSGSTGVDAQPRRGRHALGAKGLTAYRTAAVEGYLKFLDRLGLEKVYVQAKRWSGSVGRPDVQGFYGALAGQRANKGVFITTSAFTTQAIEFAKSVERIVLVDGQRLAELMIDHEVGVTSRAVRIPKLDGDYFEL